MIGHYLLTLTPIQEDRVLTHSFGPTINRECERCLVMTVLPGVALDWVGTTMGTARPIEPGRWMNGPGYRYEYLCFRFGTRRVNAAIRNRILANQARRALAAVRETVSV